MHFRCIFAALSLSIFATPVFADRLELTVERAQQSFDQWTGRPVVAISLDKESSQAFADFTSENVGKVIDFYVGDEIHTSPVVQEPILGGELQISGEFTVEEAVGLAVQLARGDIAISVEVQD